MLFGVRTTNEIRQNADNTRTTVIINTLAKDTYRTVIDPNGADLSRYQKNPVFLINHDQRLLAGNGANVRIQNNQIIAEVDDSAWDLEDSEIKRYYEKVKRGIMRMASIGFDYDSKDVTEETDEEGGKFWRINKWQLTEWSFVAIGSNPDALVTQRNAGNEIQQSVLDLHTRLDEIELRIGKLPEREYINQLLSDANRQPEPTPEPTPTLEVVQPVRTFDPALIREMVEKSTKQALGKA